MSCGVYLKLAADFLQQPRKPSLISRILPVLGTGAGLAGGAYLAHKGLLGNTAQDFVHSAIPSMRPTLSRLTDSAYRNGISSNVSDLAFNADNTADALHNNSIENTNNAFNNIASKINTNPALERIKNITNLSNIGGS